MLLFGVAIVLLKWRHCQVNVDICAKRSDVLHDVDVLMLCLYVHGTKKDTSSLTRPCRLYYSYKNKYFKVGRFVGSFSS